MKTYNLVLLLLLKLTLSLEENYYWREYTGTIPEDAIIGGENINNKHIYMGQAFVKDQGLIVVEILSGEKSVQAPIYGVKKIKSYIKILCGVQNSFYWFPANKTNLHVDLIDKKPVIGGHENGGVLYIGRIKHEGDLKIGKIVGYAPGDASFYFVDKDKEKAAPSYEILLYNEKNFDVRILAS